MAQWRALEARVRLRRRVRRCVPLGPEVANRRGSRSKLDTIIQTLNIRVHGGGGRIREVTARSLALRVTFEVSGSSVALAMACP